MMVVGNEGKRVMELGPWLLYHLYCGTDGFLPFRIISGLKVWSRVLELKMQREDSWWRETLYSVVYYFLAQFGCKAVWWVTLRKGSPSKGFPFDEAFSYVLVSCTCGFHRHIARCEGSSVYLRSHMTSWKEPGTGSEERWILDLPRSLVLCLWVSQLTSFRSQFFAF